MSCLFGVTMAWLGGSGGVWKESTVLVTFKHPQKQERNEKDEKYNERDFMLSEAFGRQVFMQASCRGNAGYDVCFVRVECGGKRRR